MRQPEDNRTLDLLDPPKRGRGRPRSPNPLSAAERARRYRAKKNRQKSEHNSQGTPASNASARTMGAIANQYAQIDQLRVDLATAIGAIELFIEYRNKHRKMPADIFRNLCQSHLRLVARNKTS